MERDRERDREPSPVSCVYDPAEHDGVAFEDLPDYWVCPRCKQGKERFNRA
ncbi:MAG: rubredoxin [Mogibacterium sp.]|nr:rubredoxin [Mogibacterium sp.]